MQFFLYKTIKAVFWLSLIASAYLYFHKDELPEASFYDLELLDDPIQTGGTMPVKQFTSAISK